jgi:hypothetical protein
MMWMTVLLLAVILVSVVVGLVLLAVFGGRIGRIIAGVIGGGMVLLMLTASGLRWLTADAKRQEVSTSFELEYERDIPAGALPSAAGVLPSVGSEIWPADVYPSRDQAVGGAVRGLAIRVSDIAPDADYERVVVVSDAPESLVHTASMELNRAILRESNVVDPVQPDANSVLRVELRHSGDPNAQRGQVELQARISGRAIDASARYVRKDWLVDLPAFRREHPSDRWHAIHTSGVHASEQLARRAALEEAMVRLMVPTLQAVQERDYRSPLKQPSPSEVQDELRRRLRSGSMISDEFVQQIDRPYGTIHRVSLLVREDHRVLDDIASTVTRRRDSVARDWLWTAGSVGGVSVVVLLVYLLVNAATKGYYTWSLRIGAVALAAGGAVLVLLAV